MHPFVLTERLSGWALSALCKMAVKLSGWTLLEDPDMYIRRSRNALLSHPASGAGCEISGECLTSPDQNSGCETFGWNGGGAEFRMWDIRVEWRRSRISDVIHPGEVAAVGWNSYPGGMSRIPYSLHFGFAYGKGLQSFSSSCFWAFHCLAMDSKRRSSI